VRRVAYLCACLVLSSGGAAFAEGISWAKDWSAAQASAKAQKKLIMVDFFTSWCGWCKKLDQDTYTDAKVVKLASQMVSVKLDAEKEGRQLAAKYSVQGFPTILFIDPAGELVGRIGGYLPPAGFAEEMTRAQTSFADLPKIQAALKAKPEDGEANAKMALMLAGRGKLKEAEAHLERAEKAGYTGQPLAQAVNGVADLYQTSGKLEEALKLFKKNDQAGVKAAQRSYAMISIVSCYLQKKDLEAARKEAKALVQLKDADPEHVKMAQGVLQGRGQ
jgi:thiol-disulfide isomerase/thioredoxin